MIGQRQRSVRRHSRDAGFTLLELLVALTLLAMLMVIIPGTLKLAARASATSAGLLESEDGGSAMEFLSHTLAEAMPLREHDGEGTLTIAFTGDAQTLSFVAPLANGPAGGGLYRVRLNVETQAGGRGPALVLRLFAHGAGEAPPLEERRIGGTLASAEFRYFGVQDPNTGPAWTGTWAPTDALPDLVEFTLMAAGSNVSSLQTHRVELRLRRRS